jgi:hypothetical protein
VAGGGDVVTRIERFSSRADAELARSVLETNGIPAYVAGDDAGGLHPELPYGFGGTAVVVPEDLYREAIAILDDEYGDSAVDAAELEAAAIAAGPAEGALPGELPYPAGREVIASDDDVTPSGEGEPSTRRSGPRRTWFLVVLGLMLAALVLGQLLVEGGLTVWRAG